MKKFILLLLAGAAVSVINSGSAFAGCPPTEALRNQLGAQLQAKIDRVVSTKNCALIPGVLALRAQLNATMHRALIAADCTDEGAPMSVAQLVTILRNVCDPNHAKGATQTAATLPPTKTASTPKNAAVKEAEATPSAPARVAKPPAPRQAAAPNPIQQQTADCSTITGLGGGSAPSNCTPSNGVPANVQAQINQTQSNRVPTIKAPSNTSPPSKGEALEALRGLMPDLGRLLDATADAVNSPNTPPPDQWTNVSTPPSTANPSRPQTGPSGSEPTPNQNDQPNVPTMTTDATPEPASPVQDSPDDDYAAICKSESVKNGLKSLKQDFEEAQKDEQGRFGIKFFREKLKLQWATLKKCVRDPMQKAVLDKLDRDPIILDPDADNQQTITPK